MAKKQLLALSLLLIMAIIPLYSMDFKVAEEDGVKFEWVIMEGEIHIKLTAPAKGWIAIGFNPSRAMKDADYKMGYVDGDKVVLEDHFGTAMFRHQEDTRIGGKNDFELIGGSETGNQTFLEFVMPLNSGDEYDSVLVEGAETKVLLAYASTDNMSRKHSWRTSITIRL